MRVMFRFFVCLSLIFAHVFCQTTEDTTEFWDSFNVTDYVEETTQSSEENLLTTIPITATTSTCPPSITIENLDEMKQEIINTIISDLSLEISKKFEEMEARLSSTSCSKGNVNPDKPLVLSHQIYENLHIPLTGWLNVFDQPYSHPTRTDDLNQLAGLCHNDVLVGATYKQSLVLAAVGPATVLSINTPWNQPQQFGQVYWYRTNGKSFGFSPDSVIRQTSGDTNDITNTKRLSWILDQNVGGYRVGSTRAIVDDSLWHKVVYCN